MQADVKAVRRLQVIVEYPSDCQLLTVTGPAFISKLQPKDRLQALHTMYTTRFIVRNTVISVQHH